MDCKLYTYGQISELYGGIEGQAFLDAVTTEHSKLTASSMTYEQIGELADDSKVGHQMSFTEHSSYSD